METLPIPEGWNLSETKPGYYEKKYRRGNATIIILRPLLTPEEAAKRDAELMAANDQLILAAERMRRQQAMQS